MKLRRTPILVAALLILALLGCSKVESKFVGKWQNEHLPETVQFLNDKTGVFEVKDNPSVPFKWSVIDDNRIKLDITLSGATKSLTGKLDKDVFILGDQNQQAIYRKIK